MKNNNPSNDKLSNSVGSLITGNIVNSIKDKYIGDLSSYFRSKCIYTIQVQNVWIIGAFAKYVLPKYTKPNDDFGYFRSKYFNGEHQYINAFEPIAFDLSISTDDILSYTIKYKNVIMIVSFEYCSNDAEDFSQTILKFKCLNTANNVKIMREFVEKSSKYAMKCLYYNKRHDTMLEVHSMRFSNSRVHTKSLIQKRDFSNVYVDDNVIESIDKSLTSFINNRDFYNKHGIPYHFGILLSGPPATGKSSLVNVIASNYCDKMITTSLMELTVMIDSIINIIKSCVSPVLIVVEDIDCQALSRDRRETMNHSDGSKYDTNDNGVALSDVLNIIDGSNALTNCVFIFTTNYVENIEPALIRPGRIDLHLEINPPSKESLNKFFKAYYGKEHGLDEIKPNLSIADLQTKVLIGYTYEQLRDYCNIE